MKSTNEYKAKVPECIYVVTWDDKFRVYVREGQANNWFCEKVKEGKNAFIKKYIPAELAGGYV